MEVLCWARELTKLGHQIRLMPAKDVKAYVKHNKNDAADAEAICEAVGRPTMRFVGVKSAKQQGRLMRHRARDLLLRQQTQVRRQERDGLEQSRWIEEISDEDEDAATDCDVQSFPAPSIRHADGLEEASVVVGSARDVIWSLHRAHQSNLDGPCSYKHFEITTAREKPG
jgi:hypothetical protein